MSSDKYPKLILINPWIYDFTAFDLWSKPLGLLYLASFLRSQGYQLEYFDCLDKYRSSSKPVIKKYGTGNFRRTVVEKPQILNHIPRNYARYGVPDEQLQVFLSENIDADAILVTSLMTYWYPGVKKVVEMVRKVLPDVPVITGGVYASLLPEHIESVVQPDYNITGPAELKLLELLSKLTGFSGGNNRLPAAIDDYPLPAFDLINHPDYLLMMTSRGCPYNCSFCAQNQISMPFRQRSVAAVLEEFRNHYRQYQLRDFAFYDDALFLRKDRHIKPILEGLIKSRLPIRLHSPNGLFARDIDKELAALMYNSRFMTVRLSFETSNEDRRQDMYSKVSNDDMIQAVANLKLAGFTAKDLDSYVMMGLPGQEIE